MNKNEGDRSTRIESEKVGRTSAVLTRGSTPVAKGQVKQASGELETKLGEQLDEVRKWTVQRPLTAIVITACIAFVSGARWASQWHRDNS